MFVQQLGVLDLAKMILIARCSNIDSVFRFWPHFVVMSSVTLASALPHTQTDNQRHSVVVSKRDRQTESQTEGQTARNMQNLLD